ncbi:MAG: AIPR family protein [Syntrophothermus sp.]|uniref:AIPR family protein n=1 Tax=Syntrophothermus sp. TaxID=2736299 RepID=UPI002579B51E|nr:AIPR family protein [Syntrophothermus sp.]NSW83899.1 AIPR family protein [Syntrophothermus sp.]
MAGELSHEVTLRTRTDLERYGKNRRLLFALQVKFRVDDIHSIAANCLTDGSDDKKCDLIYIDKDEGFAVIAQAYEAQEIDERTAPSNKAADLNIAASWLLNQSIDDLPERLRSAAQELHTALESQTIRILYFWYVHNLNESENVSRELSAVESAARSFLKNKFPDCGIEEVNAVEVGRTTLEEWYKASLTPILVTQKFEIPVYGGYEIQGEDWSAYVTSVHACWLYDIYQNFGAQLFSANIRDYLGSRRSDSNINYGIKITAENDPGRFWAFNNGLTGLVNNFYTRVDDDRTILVIEGLSIVNGAQTTGAIGSLNTRPSEKAMVPARFVKCSNQETIQNIIQYNNSQNKITASDFRSNDPVQKRLREEFQHIPNATYLGGRRGGEQDSISRPQNLIPSNTAAQALAAFHQDPVTAYNSKSEIWDRLYPKYFNEQTHAEHIVFVYSLLRCIEDKKLKLREKEQNGFQLTELEKQQLDFLRNRGATFVLVAAVAKCLETVLGRAIPNLFSLSFNTRISPREATELWVPIIDATIPFCHCLNDAVKNGLKSTEKVTSSIMTFRNMVEATKMANSEVYRNFCSRVKLSQ